MPNLSPGIEPRDDDSSVRFDADSQHTVQYCRSTVAMIATLRRSAVHDKYRLSIPENRCDEPPRPVVQTSEDQANSVGETPN